MNRDIVEPTQNEREDETHPAYGMIRASRVNNSPGSVLFDSDLQHQQSVVLTISRATRKRQLNRDWVHSDKDLIEVEMSEAQWASFVSSMNTSGVPCTLRRTENEIKVPGLLHAPRLAESAAEVHSAAETAFEEIQKALEAYEAALSSKAPAKERSALLNDLHWAIKNAVPNVDYAGKSLAGYVENVVQKARADLEAMVARHADHLGLDPASTASALALTRGDES